MGARFESGLPRAHVRLQKTCLLVLCSFAGESPGPYATSINESVADHQRRRPRADRYWKIFDIEDLTTPPGPRLVELIDHHIDEFVGKYEPLYPAAVKCLLTDRAGLTAYLRFPRRAPPSHPALGSSKERPARAAAGSRSSAGFPARPCLTLVWAVLDRASGGWRGLTMTADGLRRDALHGLLRRAAAPTLRVDHWHARLPPFRQGVIARERMLVAGTARRWPAGAAADSSSTDQTGIITAPQTTPSRVQPASTRAA